MIDVPGESLGETRKELRREIRVPQSRWQVWQALTDPDTLADWMFPNDIEPRVGHRFTFRVPPNPQAKFDGLTVHCEVLVCEPPQGDAGGRLAFTWSAGDVVVDTRVSFTLEPDGAGTRVVLQHSGFDLTRPRGEQAFKGAAFGWAKMLGQLPDALARSAANRTRARSLHEGDGR